VIHACERARDVLPLVEGQLAVGMRPYIVTPQGCGAAESYLGSSGPETARPASLLRAWQDVRNWRQSLSQCDPRAPAEIIHAHSFAAGMAAVRGWPVVVYDLEAFVEETARAAGQCAEGSWIGRSFRAAEQFVIGRVAALVVHCLAMRRSCLERAAREEDVFVVPPPLDLGAWQIRPDPEWLNRTVNGGRRAVTFFAAGFELEDHAQALPPALLRLLDSFAIVHSEVEDARLLLAADSTALAQQTAAREIAGAVLAIAPPDRERALVSVDVVIAGKGKTTLPAGSNFSALVALANHRALLAADEESNRDLSPDGRGCLWYRQDDVRDLAYRAAFLARSPSRHAFRLCLCVATVSSAEKWNGAKEKKRAQRATDP